MLGESDGERRASQQARGQNHACGFDRLGEERKPVDRFHIGVEHRHAGRDREDIAGDQTGEDSRRPEECELRRLAGQDDGEDGEQDRGDDEAEPGSRAFLEVVLDEGAVDAGADRAREDDEVDTQFGPASVRHCSSFPLL